MRSARLTVFPLLLTLLAPQALLAARTWTSGDFRVEADLAEVRGQLVVLKKQDGGFVEIEIAKLAQADQDYLNKKRELVGQTQTLVDQVRAMLAADDIEKANEQLELAKRAAADDAALQAQVANVAQAVRDYATFLTAYRDGLKTVKVGTPFQRQGYNHEVLLVNDNDLVVRGRRGKYRFNLNARDKMPTWLTVMIAKRSSGSEDLSKEVDIFRRLNSPSTNRRRWDQSLLKPKSFESLLAQSQTVKPTEEPKEPQAKPAAPVETAPVPAIQKLTETVTQVRDLYKEQYESAKTALPARVTLIKTLIDESDKLSADDPTAFFVMRFEAATKAAELGDVAKALETIDPLNARFEAEGMLPHKANLVSRAVEAIKRTRSDPQARSTIDAAVALKDEALQFEQFETAKGLIESAKMMARMLREKALIAQVNALKTGVDRREALHRDAEEAKKKVATTPDDPDANLKLGLYQSFVRNNWKEGLPQLAKSNVVSIAEVAKLDLENPEEAGGKKTVGDRWWQLAESPKYKDFKDALQDRAAVWYRGAVGELSSLAKTSVEKRLKEVENRARPASAGDNNVFLTQLRPLGVLGLEIDPGDPPMHRTVTINGRKYPNSVWGQPEDYEGRAKISYALGKKFDTLRGGVGFDPGYYDTLPNSSPVIFRIEGDGKVLWITPAPLGPKATATFKIDVSRVNVITFTTACFGANYYARAAWATPILTKKPQRKK